MTSQSMVRNVGVPVSFILVGQGGTTTVRTTPDGTRFHMTHITFSGEDVGGGDDDVQLQVDGVAIWSGRIGNSAGIGAIVFDSPLNNLHIGDGIEIIRIVGGTIDAYDVVLSGFDS